MNEHTKNYLYTGISNLIHKLQSIWHKTKKCTGFEKLFDIFVTALICNCTIHEVYHVRIIL